MIKELKTIQDFGAQWSKDSDNSGWYGSTELLSDILQPLMTLQEIKGKRVLDIGSGSGRIIKMLIDAEAEHVCGIEPSSGYYFIKKNTESLGNRVQLIHGTGENAPRDETFDIAISIGVIQFIKDPNLTMQAVLESLKPKGKFVVWLYSIEGNRFYVYFIRIVRTFTRILNDKLLWFLVKYLIDPILIIYMMLCKFIPLPLSNYIKGVLCNLTSEKRQLTIYDQLNPSYAKYYSKDEAYELFKVNGFESIKIHHRRKYSWTIIGKRPADVKINVHKRKKTTNH